MRYFKRVATTKSESWALYDCTAHTPWSHALIQGMGATLVEKQARKHSKLGAHKHQDRNLKMRPSTSSGKVGLSILIISLKDLLSRERGNHNKQLMVLYFLHLSPKSWPRPSERPQVSEGLAQPGRRGSLDAETRDRNRHGLIF